MRKRRFNKKKNFIFFFGVVFIFFILLQVVIFKFLLNRESLLSPIAGGNWIFNNKEESFYEYKKALSKANIQYEKIAVDSDNSVRVFLKNKAEIIFSLDKDLDGQISSLQLIVNRSTIEGKRVSRLDFRFEKPVVQYGN